MSTDTRDGCRVAQSSEQSLKITAKLIGCDVEKLREALVTRVMMSIVHVPLNCSHASNARDALAKSVYTRVFDHIICLVNQSIPFQKSAYHIGLLDIAGFECLAANDFEQLCSNFCNEKLQQSFNTNVIANDQELYKREGLNFQQIKYSDNQGIIDLFDTKNKGIFALLDEEAKAVKPSNTHFTASLLDAWRGNPRISLPRGTKMHRELSENEGFVVKHFAGPVCYYTKEFSRRTTTHCMDRWKV